jgi:hypothetical protein
MSRSCFKIARLRQTIDPARVFSVCGLGSNDDNWDRIQSLRKSGLGKKWIKYSSADEVVEGWEINGMEQYEEQRLAGMKLVSGFADVKGWKDM